MPDTNSPALPSAAVPNDTNDAPPDHLQAAELHIGYLREMLQALANLSHMDVASDTLEIEDFGRIVWRLCERGVVFCEDAQRELERFSMERRNDALYGPRKARLGDDHGQ